MGSAESIDHAGIAAAVSTSNVEVLQAALRRAENTRPTGTQDEKALQWFQQFCSLSASISTRLLLSIDKLSKLEDTQTRALVAERSLQHYIMLQQARVKTQREGWMFSDPLGALTRARVSLAASWRKTLEADLRLCRGRNQAHRVQIGRFYSVVYESLDQMEHWFKIPQVAADDINSISEFDSTEHLEPVDQEKDAEYLELVRREKEVKQLIARLRADAARDMQSLMHSTQPFVRNLRAFAASGKEPDYSLNTLSLSITEKYCELAFGMLDDAAVDQQPDLKQLKRWVGGFAGFLGAVPGWIALGPLGSTLSATVIGYLSADLVESRIQPKLDAKQATSRYTAIMMATWVYFPLVAALNIQMLLWGIQDGR